MDTVAVILSAARGASAIIIEHKAAEGFYVRFLADRDTFLQAFAAAGLRPGDRSGFTMLQATTAAAIFRATVE
jgi:hypothetical protein